MKILSLLAALLAALPLQARTLLPAPASDRPGTRGFTLTASTPIAFMPGLGDAARYLSEYLPGLPLSEGDVDRPAVRLRIDPALGAEAYRLTVDTWSVALEGGDYAGVINALHTLLELLPPTVYARGPISLPLTLEGRTIEDRPAFAYRGIMLDVARTWLEAPRLKRCIDLLAYHKINKLHLHLCDDEGWRIEIRSHPELTAEGAFRGGDSPVRAVYGRWNERYGGYYTQEEMRDIVRYAARRGVEIIPEIDLPGHSRTVAQLHPEILCRYTAPTSATGGYDYRNAWCVAREENYRLLEEILGELCDLFPSEHFHIGGDEVDFSQWQRCPDCTALMRAEKWSDPHRLEDRFMERVSQILTRHGKQPAVWNEAIRSGRLPLSTRVHGWEKLSACLDAADKGYRTVVMPAEFLYFDMRQSEHDVGHRWAAVFDVRHVYAFDPSSLFTPAQLCHVEGLEAAFWSELGLAHGLDRSDDYLDYMLFPRLCALAENAWSNRPRDWKAFRERLAAHYERLTAMGVRFRLQPPAVAYADGKLSASVNDGSRIEYAVDGGEGYVPYEGPIETRTPRDYRFRSSLGTGRSPDAAVPSRYATIRPAVRITSSIAPSGKFPFSNAETYRGIARTLRTAREGDWIIYAFERPIACRRLFVTTGYAHIAQYVMANGRAEVSYDGVTFEPAGELTGGGIVIESPRRPVRAVRLTATGPGSSTPFLVVQPPVVYPL